MGDLKTFFKVLLVLETKFLEFWMKILIVFLIQSLLKVIFLTIHHFMMITGNKILINQKKSQLHKQQILLMVQIQTTLLINLLKPKVL